MAKFSVGDRVQVFSFPDDPDNGKYIRLNDTGTVVFYVDDGLMCVKWDNPVKESFDNHWWVNPKGCELVSH